MLVNLGTPESPSSRDVGRFLREFLSDPRVVDAPRWWWLPLLNYVISPIRAPQSAGLYRSIWMDEGSPLAYYSLSLGQKLEAELSGMPVEVAMTYGEPSALTAWRALQRRGVEEVVVVPLYPQYSSTTSGAVLDAVTNALRNERAVPAVRFIRDYADDPGYVAALADSLLDSFYEHGPGKVVFSFHGLPVRYVEDGDDYCDRISATVNAVVDRLGLGPDDWEITYQSVFGREQWLTPATVERMAQLPGEGRYRVHVICPGFATDCLETLEEIAIRNREEFLSAGGYEFHYVPALNDSDAHVRVLSGVLSGMLTKN